MESKKNYKILAIILLVVVIANSVLFFNQVSELFTVSDALQNFTSASMYLFVFINFVVALIFFVIVFKALKTNDLTTQQTFTAEQINTEKKAKESEAAKQQKEQAKKEAEEQRKEQKINNILNGLDEITDIKDYTEKLFANIAEEEQIVQGLLYLKDPDSNKFILKGSYAFYSEEKISELQEGEGLSGQVAANREMLKISEIPEGYIKVFSGLGGSTPSYLLIIPAVKEDETMAILELAAFEDFDSAYIEIYNKVSTKIAQDLEHLSQETEEQDSEEQSSEDKNQDAGEKSE